MSRITESLPVQPLHNFSGTGDLMVHRLGKFQSLWVCLSKLYPSETQSKIFRQTPHTLKNFCSHLNVVRFQGVAVMQSYVPSGEQCEYSDRKSRDAHDVTAQACHWCVAIHVRVQRQCGVGVCAVQIQPGLHLIADKHLKTNTPRMTTCKN